MIKNLSTYRKESEAVITHRCKGSLKAGVSIRYAYPYPYQWICHNVEGMMNDLISRKALCDYALNQKDKSVTPNDIMRFPSAQPEQRWIPCSERLPEEYGEYICTMENGQVQECGFVPENQRGLVDGWSTCEADGYKFLGYVDVLAWMPLPESYSGE